MNFSWVRVTAFVLLVSMAAADTVFGQSSFRPLPDLGFGGIAHDISRDGVVVGAVVIDASSTLSPAVWRGLDSAPQLLPTDGRGGFANAINASGVVVGSKFAKVGAGNSPVYWVDGVMKELPTLGEGGQALDINDSGLIVGYVRSGQDILPSFWRDDELKLLPYPSIGTAGSIISAQANSVNASGTIVGTVKVAFGAESISLKWVNGTLQTAASDNWVETRGVDIDDSGNVLVNGYFDLNGPFSIATYSATGVSEIFDSPEYVRNVWGTAMANDGTVVGYFYDFSTVPSGLQAGAWRKDRFFPLSRPQGMRWSLPLAVSDSGTVVGYVSDGVSGTSVPGYWLIDDSGSNGAGIELLPQAGFPGESVVLVASVTEAEKALPGETVTFELGETVIGKAISDAQGIARLNFAIPASAKAGGHEISASTSDGIEDEASLDVKWVPTQTNLARPTARPGQTIQASGTLVNGLNRTPLRNQSVVLRIQGTEFVARSNADGRFSVSYRVPRNARRGSAIPVQAVFPGNVNHARSTFESTIRIR